MLYASYNTITLTSILIPMKEKIKSKKSAIIIAVLCASIILVLAFIIFIILINTNVDVSKIDLPAIYAIKRFGSIYSNLYGIVILGAIFTTAISSAYAFLNNVSKTEKQYKKYNLIICTSAIFVSRFGFSALVNYLYPIFGILGLIQLGFIVCLPKEKNT